ncbi:unnamed protein product [Penicillium olsonii]|nr:unnamed protein product [Penicillium olsonii]
MGFQETQHVQMDMYSRSAIVALSVQPPGVNELFVCLFVSRFDRLIETLLGAVGEVEIGVGDLTADRTAIFFRGGGSGIFSARRSYLLSAASSRLFFLVLGQSNIVS